MQRIHSYRAELATQVMKVPESHVRVVAGDIGGSFGMKSAIYNEVPLVLLASKLVGRPVKWTSTRSEAFLGDAQARDNVSDAELALDADGHFLGFRVRTISAVGAYPQIGSNAFRRQSRDPCRGLPHPRGARRSHRGLHQYQPGAALSRQWPAGIRLHYRAHGRLMPPTNSASIRSNCAAAT